MATTSSTLHIREFVYYNLTKEMANIESKIRLFPNFHKFLPLILPQRQFVLSEKNYTNVTCAKF